MKVLLLCFRQMQLGRTNAIGPQKGWNRATLNPMAPNSEPQSECPTGALRRGPSNPGVHSRRSREERYRQSARTAHRPTRDWRRRRSREKRNRQSARTAHRPTRDWRCRRSRRLRSSDGCLH